MSLAFRIFMILYAAAMIAITVAVYLQEVSPDYYVELWWLVGASSISYLVLAIGYLIAKDCEKAPPRPPLAIVYGLALSLLVPVAAVATPLDSGRAIFLIFGSVSLFAYMAASAFLLRDLRFGVLDVGRLRRTLLRVSLLAGAGMALSSLSLKIADMGVGTGWNVVTRKASWITSGINVATGLFGPRIEWLEKFYAPVGYVVYLLGLGATIAVWVWLIQARLSVERLRTSSIGVWLAVIMSLCSMWVITDIFWAWHFDLSSIPWAAAVATTLWLAGPLFGVALLVPALWGKREGWRLRAFLVFQLPMAAFNLLMLPAYYGERNLGIPGLGMLILGLQLEGWACMDLLAVREKTSPVTLPARVNAMAA